MAEPQENGVKKGPWSIEEDEKLKDFIEKNGQGSWQIIPKQAGLNRCGKSCRLRWANYLKPGIKRGGFSAEEEAAIIALHEQLGNKWSKIASHLPRRTDNEIKNFWNTHLRKKLLRMRIDPITHRRIPDLNLLNISQAHELLSSSVSTPTPYNFINPLDVALALQANANDLIKMQMIQNMLQVINANPLPYIQGNTNLGDLIQFNRLFDGTNTNFTHVNPSQAQSSKMSDLSNISPMLNHQPSPSNSFPCFAGEIIPGPGGGMNDNIQGSCTSNMYNSEYSLPCYTSNMYSSEYSLPSLVSATPESFTTNNELESVKQITASEGLDQESNNVFDAWENLIDEEASSCFWKDILG